MADISSTTPGFDVKTTGSSDDGAGKTRTPGKTPGGEGPTAPKAPGNGRSPGPGPKLPDFSTDSSGNPVHRHKGPNASCEQWHPVSRRHRDAHGKDVTEQVHMSGGVGRDGLGPDTASRRASGGAPKAPTATAGASVADVLGTLAAGRGGEGVVRRLAGRVGDLMRAVVTGDVSGAVGIMGDAVSSSIGDAADRVSAIYGRYGITPGADPTILSRTFAGKAFDADRTASLRGIDQGMADIEAALGDKDVSTMDMYGLKEVQDTLERTAGSDLSMDIGGRKVTLRDYVSAYASGDPGIGKADGRAAVERLRIIQDTMSQVAARSKDREKELKAEGRDARARAAEANRRAAETRRRINEVIRDHRANMAQRDRDFRNARRAMEEAERDRENDRRDRREEFFQQNASGAQKLLRKYTRNNNEAPFGEDNLPLFFKASMQNLLSDANANAARIAEKWGARFTKIDEETVTLGAYDDGEQAVHDTVKRNIMSSSLSDEEKRREWNDYNSYLNLAYGLAMKKNHTRMIERWQRKGDLPQSYISQCSNLFAKSISKLDSRTVMDADKGVVRDVGDHLDFLENDRDLKQYMEMKDNLLLAEKVIDRFKRGVLADQVKGALDSTNTPEGLAAALESMNERAAAPRPDGPLDSEEAVRGYLTDNFSRPKGDRVRNDWGGMAKAVIDLGIDPRYIPKDMASKISRSVRDGMFSGPFKDAFAARMGISVTAPTARVDPEDVFARIGRGEVSVSDLSDTERAGLESYAAALGKGDPRRARYLGYLGKD